MFVDDEDFKFFLRQVKKYKEEFEIKMFVDTHAHLNFNAFENDVDEVIRRALKSDVWIINVGSQYTTSKRAVEIAEKYGQGVYAAIGLHPIHLETGLVKIKIDPSELAAPSPTQSGSGRTEKPSPPPTSSGAGWAEPEKIEFRTKGEEFDYEKYKELARSNKVVAVGEIGLDYYYKPKTKIKLEQFKEKQKEVFLKQLDLVKELNLPVIFHCRSAHEELLRVLKSEILKSNIQHLKSNLKGVVHCFTGNLEQAQKYLEMGFYLGFNGLIFKKIEGLPNPDEIIKNVPLEKILIETDAPYLTPPPATPGAAGGGVIRNEPIFVKYVAQKIAEIKNESFEKVAEATTQNARELFRT